MQVYTEVTPAFQHPKSNIVTTRKTQQQINNRTWVTIKLSASFSQKLPSEISGQVYIFFNIETKTRHRNFLKILLSFLSEL